LTLLLILSAAALFAADDVLTRVAARTLALAAVELFENPAEVKAARDAYEKRLAGRQWTTRIKADSKPPLDSATK